MGETKVPGYLQGPMREAAGRLLLSYEEVKHKHRGESGKAREVAVATELLDRFLPAKLAVASGEIVSSDGQMSSQHDIIVYDALETPILNAADRSVVIPIEGVYAVVEVSSTLNGAKLRVDAEKIARTKRMPKNKEQGFFRQDKVLVQGFSLHGRDYSDFPVLGFCFGYDGVDVGMLVSELRELDALTPVNERVDMACCLSKGCIANGIPASDDPGANPFKDLEGAPSPDNERAALRLDPGTALMMFHLLGMGLVVQAHTYPIRLVPYMNVGPD